MQNLKLVILPLFLFDVRENFLLVGSTNDNYSRLFIIGNLNRLVVHIDMRNNERHLIDRPAKFFGDANGCWLVALRYLKRSNNYRRSYVLTIDWIGLDQFALRKHYKTIC
ncbi:hypothetical protein T12_14825 [Trichinella patagoniensis]|uniref:Uncharacterized protein n=1 Tax=Trichinella patagoniensis TaxID=990121 RepID=A0A0V0ZLU4_9BILA|nr:hypothetical protein T12_14825 [Trichinella patagoniensis]